MTHLPPTDCIWIPTSSPQKNLKDSWKIFYQSLIEATTLEKLAEKIKHGEEVRAKKANMPANTDIDD